MIKKLMRTLKIEYYDYLASDKTLIIYEPIPVKMLSVIRAAIPGVKLVIK